MGGYDRANGGRLADAIRENCDQAQEHLSYLRINNFLSIKFIKTLDGLRDATYASALMEPFHNYKNTYFTDERYSLVEAMSHLFDDEGASVGRRVDKLKISNAFKAIEEAVNVLDLPPHIRYLIEKDIERIRFVLQNIESIGISDIWERFWSVDSQISRSMEFQTNEIKNEIKRLSDRWKKPTLAVMVFGGMMGALSFTANTMQVSSFWGVSNKEEAVKFITNELSPRLMPAPSSDNQKEKFD